MASKPKHIARSIREKRCFDLVRNSDSWCIGTVMVLRTWNRQLSFDSGFKILATIRSTAVPCCLTFEPDNVRVHRARTKSTALKPARERAPCATHCYPAHSCDNPILPDRSRSSERQSEIWSQMPHPILPDVLESSTCSRAVIVSYLAG